MTKVYIYLCLFCAIVSECFGQSVSPCIIPTINPSFEQPVIPVNSYSNKSENDLPGWKTTASDHQIEMWSSGFGGLIAFDGNQFIELNANVVSTLYQDFSTPSPTVFTVHFAHRGRSGTDVCRVYAGSPGGATTTVVYASDNNVTWGVYNTTYTVPAGQTTTRFSFESLSSAGGPSVGNFLDDIQFTADNDIKGLNPITVCGTSGQAHTSADGVGTWVPSGSNPGLTTIVQAPSDLRNSTVISGFPVTGTYTYTWQTGYCSPTLTIHVVSIPPATTITSNSPVPVNGTVSLSATSMPNIASYAWTGPNLWNSNVQNPTIPNVTVSNSGLYTLVTTSTSGCQSISTSILVVVTNAISTTSNSSICSGNTLSLSTTLVAPGLGLTTYFWEGPSGFSSTLQNPTISNTTAVMSGTYTVTATTGGVSASESIDVIIYDTPTVPIINTNSPVCSGNTLTITANTVPGAIYHWTGPNGFVLNSTNPLVTINNADLTMRGSYTLTITSINGCSSLPESRFIDVITGTSEPNVTSNLPVCVGGSLDLATDVSGPAYLYLWEGPNGFVSTAQMVSMENVDTTMSGTYTLTITVPGLACQYPPAFVAVDVLPSTSVSAGSDLVILQHSSEKLQATASGNYLVFKWEPSTYLDNDAILNPTVIHPKSNIKYRLTATSVIAGILACSAFSEVSITVPFTVPNVFTPNGDGVEDTFEIGGINNYPQAAVSIFDRRGKLLYSSIGYQNPWDGAFHGIGLPVATYYYEIDLGNGAKSVGGYVYLMR